MIAAIAWTLALLGAALGARRSGAWLAGALELGPLSAGGLGGAIYVSALMVPIALFARVAGNFDLGLCAAAAFGVALYLVSRKWAFASPPTLEWALRIRVGLALILVGVLFGYLAHAYQMHDEHPIFGHKAMVEQLRRNAYPLYVPPFPGEEARYHYGFDLLAGAFARAYGLSSDNAIDLVTVALCLLMSLLAAAVAVELGDRRSAPFAALAIHLGGGLAFVLLAGVPGRYARCLVQYHHPTCGVELFPTQILNVFQHPVAVGVPLFLAAVLLLPRLGHEPLRPLRGRAFWAAAGLATLIMAGAAIGQFVYFALAGAAALSAYPIWTLKTPGAWKKPSGLVAIVLVLAAAFILAKLMGGMLAPNASIDPALFGAKKTLGYPINAKLSGILYFYTVNLGVGFLLLPVLLFAAFKQRKGGVVMLLSAAIGGALVPQLFFYARSWDIIKFPSAASFFLSILFVLVIDRFLLLRGRPWVFLRPIGMVAVMGTGLLGAWFLLRPLPGDQRLYETSPWYGDGVVRNTITWLRSHDYDSKDLILAQSNVAQEMSVFGGLSVVGDDTDMYYLGIKQSILDRQRRLAERARRSLDPQALGELHIKWLVYSDEELLNLGAEAQAKLADPSFPADVVAEYPGDRPNRRRRIWRMR